MYEAGTLEPAYILHARNYRNTSLILDLFTRDSGRYSVVSKGVRSPKSKIRSRLQPFSPLLIASVGRGELKTSTTIDFPGRPFWLVGKALMLGLYVNELLYRLLDRYDPVAGLYRGYEDLLLELVSSEQSLSGQSFSGQAPSVESVSVQHSGSQVTAIRRFELCLLQELGYGINFEYDSRDGQPISADLSYRFVVHEGFHAAQESQGETFSGSEVLRMASGDLEQVDSRRLLNLTRFSLAELLGDKPLKSRSLFRGAR
ncbi:MAG: DNA repair protein RecO [Candidatus Azotimanducaceae bacterium WSBS_2022_MAG_OTU7]